MEWISAYRQKAELEQRLLPSELSSLSAMSGIFAIIDARAEITAEADLILVS
jgi:hypothetical protein